MTLENAVIFLKGLFNEYFNDPLLAVTIETSKDSYNEILSTFEFNDEEFK